MHDRGTGSNDGVSIAHISGSSPVLDLIPSREKSLEKKMARSVCRVSDFDLVAYPEIGFRRSSQEGLMNGVRFRVGPG